MATKRLSVGIKNVNWQDGQQVTKDDLVDFRDRDVNIDAAGIANFHGSGIIINETVQTVLLDTNNLNTPQQTLLNSNSFDGQNVYIGSVNSVSDSIQGVQLSVTLTGVDLGGAEVTKIAIFGDTFDDELIYDELIFNENGTQITRGRYINIRGILFNNFAGNLYGSRSPAKDGSNLVGRCVIEEVSSLYSSFDHIIASQIKKPSKFFENFTPAIASQSIDTMLQNAIGSDKSVGELDISLSSISTREIEDSDVTTKIGQKFLATGENIQKISILVGVKEDVLALPADAYNWSGDITLTIYALQTEVSCPTDPTPDNAVDFDPDPAILAQLSLNSNDLEKQAIVLDGTSQKIDFVFTGTKIADPIRSPIESGKYYAMVVGRSGDTSVGTLVFEEAPRVSENGYMIIYDGTQWINITDSDMWFSIEGSYIKTSDGIAYENGVGIEVPKIKKDSTNTEVPYVNGLISIYTTDGYNYTILEQDSEYSDPQQDQRTGNQVYSRVTPAPVISLISESSFEDLLDTNPNPVVLSRVSDTNPHGNPATITGTTSYIGLVLGNKFNILNPNADLINHNWVGSILRPNTTTVYTYRIKEANLITDAYGDINGDGVIDAYDLDLLTTWVLDGYFSSPLSSSITQNQILDGYATIDQILRGDVNGDGIIDASDILSLTNYINKITNYFAAGSTYQRLEFIVEELLEPLSADADISGTDSAFTTVPFVSKSWSISFFQTWIPDLIKVEDMRRNLATVITEASTVNNPAGRNDYYVPGNILLGGRILTPEEDTHSLDFEITQFTVNMPITDTFGNPAFLDGYTGILLFDNFVSESSDGKTSSGFNALKYSDGTYVQNEDFNSGKVKIVPTLQSIANKYPSTFGGNLDDIVGLYYDPDTSLLTIYVDNLYDDGYGNTLLPKSMKINVTVYLKRAGFANETREITEDEMRTLLGI